MKSGAGFCPSTILPLTLPWSELLLQLFLHYFHHYILKLTVMCQLSDLLTFPWFGAVSLTDLFQWP